MAEITVPAPANIGVLAPPDTTLSSGGNGFALPGVAQITVVPGASLWAAVPPSLAPNALRLEVADSDGNTIVPDVPLRSALDGMVEQDGIGSITYTVGRDELLNATPPGEDLLAPTNLLRVWYGDLQIAESLLDSAPLTLDDTGRWTYVVSGRGSEAILDNAVLYPEVWKSNDDRAFDFGSKRTPYGGWYVASQWQAPVGRKVNNSFRWLINKRRWPKGWPELESKWIWSTNPELGSVDGPRWFRGSFTLTETTKIRFYAAGDDTLLLKVDGNVVLRVGAEGWHKTRTVVLTLPAGEHIVAARVTNLPATNPGPENTNRSGFVMAAGKVNSEGKIYSWVLRTKTDGWRVAHGDPPGWFPPLVIKAHVIEAVARGVTGYAGITLTFTDTADTNGVPWTNRKDINLPIGITGTELLSKIRAYGYSVSMMPGLRLCAWKNRGRDLRDYVSIGKVTAGGWPSRVWSRVRTSVLTRGGGGWRDDDTTSSTLITDFGRQEMFLSAGNAKTQSAMQAQGLAALRDAGSPEQTFEISLSSTDGPQPFIDFEIADLVSAAIHNRYVPARVKAISFTQTDTEEIQWTVTVYPLFSATPLGDA